MASLSTGLIGTWDDVFGAAPADQQAVALAVRDMIVHLHPDVVSVARPGDRAVTFGNGPRKMRDGYAYLMPQRAWVNLGFYQGAALPDPLRLLEGTGAALRHVKLRGPLPDGLAALIHAAVVLRLA